MVHAQLVRCDKNLHELLENDGLSHILDLKILGLDFDAHLLNLDLVAVLLSLFSLEAGEDLRPRWRQLQAMLTCSRNEFVGFFVM